MHITVIARSGNAVLVEWRDPEGYPKRSRVPESVIRTTPGGDLTCDDPEEGIPYGEPWASLAEASLDTVLLENLLHRAGIWTYAEYTSNMGAVLDAFRSAYAMDAQKLRENVRSRKGV